MKQMKQDKMYSEHCAFPYAWPIFVQASGLRKYFILF